MVVKFIEYFYVQFCLLLLLCYFTNLVIINLIRSPMWLTSFFTVKHVCVSVQIQSGSIRYRHVISDRWKTAGAKYTVVVSPVC